MDGFELLWAGVVFVGMLGVGTVAHELTHATVLRALGIPYELEWFPQCEGQAHLNTGLLGAWATVTPQSLDGDVPVWGLKLSAVAPLVLTTPVLLIVLGVLPDPLATGNLVLVSMLLAWLGCALPSPQDFSLFWHAEQLIEERGGRNGQSVQSPSSDM